MFGKGLVALLQGALSADSLLLSAPSVSASGAEKHFTQVLLLFLMPHASGDWATSKGPGHFSPTPDNPVGNSRSRAPCQLVENLLGLNFSHPLPLPYSPTSWVSPVPKPWPMIEAWQISVTSTLSVGDPALLFRLSNLCAKQLKYVKFLDRGSCGMLWDRSVFPNHFNTAILPIKPAGLTPGLLHIAEFCKYVAGEGGTMNLRHHTRPLNKYKLCWFLFPKQRLFLLR